MTQLMDDDAIESWFAGDRECQDASDNLFAARTRRSSEVLELESVLLCHRMEREQEEQRVVDLAVRTERDERAADALHCERAALERRERYRDAVCSIAITRRSVPSLVLHEEQMGGGRVGVSALWALVAVRIARGGYRGRSCMRDLGAPYDIARLVEDAADALQMFPLEQVDERANLPPEVMGADPPPLDEAARVPVGMKRPRDRRQSGCDDDLPPVQTTGRP